MSWFAVGATVVSAGVGIYGANKAAGAQEDAANDATGLQKYMYDQTRTDNMPALEARNAGLARLQELLGLSGDKTAQGYGSLNERFTGRDLASEPGYQFGLEQGQKQLDSSAAARGGLYSGAQLKAAQEYGNDYATTKYGAARDRFMSDQDATFNRLSGVVGSGQTGSNVIGAAGQNYANQASSNMIGAGNARGANYLAQGNLIGNGINQGMAIYQRQQAQPYQPTGNAYPTDQTDGWYTNPQAGP